LPPDFVTAILPYRLGMQALVISTLEMRTRHIRCRVPSTEPTALRKHADFHHRFTDAPLSLQRRRTFAEKLSDYIDRIFQCKGVSPVSGASAATEKT
jgi:hypothetical protein